MCATTCKRASDPRSFPQAIVRAGGEPVNRLADGRGGSDSSPGSVTQDGPTITSAVGGTQGPRGQSVHPALLAVDARLGKVMVTERDCLEDAPLRPGRFENLPYGESCLCGAPDGAAGASGRLCPWLGTSPGPTFSLRTWLVVSHLCVVDEVDSRVYSGTCFFGGLLVGRLSLNATGITLTKA